MGSGSWDLGRFGAFFGSVLSLDRRSKSSSTLKPSSNDLPPSAHHKWFDDMEPVAKSIQIDPATSIDAYSEESFTLESFETLISLAIHTDKTFILARVTTNDPSHADKHYYSYYDGHHINKVMFRTDSDQQTIHRIGANNPLNNMPVIHVEYYAISLAEAERAHLHFQNHRAKHIIQERADLDPHPEESTGPESPKSETGDLVEKTNASIHARSFSADDLRHVGSDESCDRVVYMAKYIGTDKDFMVDADLQKFFLDNAISPDDRHLFRLGRRSEVRLLLDAFTGADHRGVGGSGEEYMYLCWVWPLRRRQSPVARGVMAGVVVLAYFFLVVWMVAIVGAVSIGL